MKKIFKNIPAAFLFFVSAYFPVQVSAQHYGPEQKITVAQHFPEAVRPGSEFMVEVKISKGNVGGLAKFQQYIPQGMTASPLDNAGADFSFEAQNVKLIWTSVPADANIKVRYKVSVASTLQGKKYLSGTFSYVENDRTKKTSLVPKEIDVTPNAPATEVVSTASNPDEGAVQQKAETPSASSAIPPDESEPDETKEETSPGSASSAQTSPEVTEPKKQTEETTPAQSEPVASAPVRATAVDAATEMKASESPANRTASTVSGIIFKVQVAAMHEKHFRRKDYFREKFGLQMEVVPEEHEGLKKYTVGNFTSYAQAAKLRDEIRSGAEGSFVVAYKDGVRISVAEAIELQRKK